MFSFKFFEKRHKNLNKKMVSKRHIKQKKDGVYLEKNCFKINKYQYAYFIK